MYYDEEGDSRANEIRRSCKALSSASESNGHRVQDSPSIVHRSPLFQICVKKSCLIYQLLDDKHSIPTSLRHSLESDIKVAVARFNVDRPMLSSQLDIHIKDHIEVSRHPNDGNHYSMEEMVRMFLDFDGYPGEMKPTDIGRSNWGEEKPSMAQVIYTAVDAYVSLRLGIFIVLSYNFK